MALAHVFFQHQSLDKISAGIHAYQSHPDAGFFGKRAVNELQEEFYRLACEVIDANYADLGQRLRSFVVECKSAFYGGDLRKSIFSPILREIGLEDLVIDWDDQQRVLWEAPGLG